MNDLFLNDSPEKICLKNIDLKMNGYATGLPETFLDHIMEKQNFT